MELIIVETALHLLWPCISHEHYAILGSLALLLAFVLQINQDVSQNKKITILPDIHWQ